MAIPPEQSQTLAYFRQATDVANVCRDIVIATAVEIQGRKYVKVEGWTSIAVAHGCIATIKEGSVQEVFREGKLIGIRAVAELRRMPNNEFLSSAEGFVGADEPDWFGSHGVEIPRWNKFKRCEEKKVVEKSPDFAIRAMAQTRGISRVCRTGFSHVVVLIDKGLSTVPFEEIARGDDVERGDAGITGKIDEQQQRGQPEKAPKPEPKRVTPEPAGAPPAGDGGKKAPEVQRDPAVPLRAKFEGGKWEQVVIHFGQKKGCKLGELPDGSLRWWCDEWHPRSSAPDDVALRAALDVASVEGFEKK